MKLSASNDGVVVLIIPHPEERLRRAREARSTSDRPVEPQQDPSGHGRGGDNAPLVGYVHQRGGRVRWVDVGQIIVFRGQNATHFLGDDASIDMGLTAVMIDQSDILGVIDGITDYGKGGHATRGSDPVGDLPVGPKTDTRTFYGPHECGKCGNRIAKASIEEGGAEFDYPAEPIYPNTRWEPHVCKGGKPLPMAWPAPPPLGVT